MLELLRTLICPSLAAQKEEIGSLALGYPILVSASFLDVTQPDWEHPTPFTQQWCNPLPSPFPFHPSPGMNRKSVESYSSYNKR